MTIRESFSGLGAVLPQRARGIAVEISSQRPAARPTTARPISRLDNAEHARGQRAGHWRACSTGSATRPQLGLDAGRRLRAGSCGGYMVLASLVHYGDRHRGRRRLSSESPASRTFLETTSWPTAVTSAEPGVPAGDEARSENGGSVFERIDPLEQAARQNQNSPDGRPRPRTTRGCRSPRRSSIAPKVRANGQPVWTLYADNEGHGSSPAKKTGTTRSRR